MRTKTLAGTVLIVPDTGTFISGDATYSSLEQLIDICPIIAFAETPVITLLPP